MLIPSLLQRIGASFTALAVCWAFTVVAVVAYARDLSAAMAVMFWSMPFMAAGWLLIALPVVVAGGRILRLPIVAVVVCGAAASAAVLLLPTLLLWFVAAGRNHFLLNASYFLHWPLFAATVGAIGVLVYRWLLARAAAVAAPDLSEIAPE